MVSKFIKQKLLSSRYRQVARRKAEIEQEGKCFYCHEPMKLSKSTVDHIKARSNGGTDSHDNLVACCYDCNSSKSSMSQARFLALIKQPPTSATPFRIMRIWSRRKVWLAVERSLKRLGEIR